MGKGIRILVRTKLALKRLFQLGPLGVWPIWIREDGIKMLVRSDWALERSRRSGPPVCGRPFEL